MVANGVNAVAACCIEQLILIAAALPVELKLSSRENFEHESAVRSVFLQIGHVVLKEIRVVSERRVRYGYRAVRACVGRTYVLLVVGGRVAPYQLLCDCVGVRIIVVILSEQMIVGHGIAGSVRVIDLLFNVEAAAAVGG